MKASFPADFGSLFLSAAQMQWLRHWPAARLDAAPAGASNEHTHKSTKRQPQGLPCGFAKQTEKGV